jgi:NAD-dependent SIR2 family protein deacetylase
MMELLPECARCGNIVSEEYAKHFENDFRLLCPQCKRDVRKEIFRA